MLVNSKLQNTGRQAALFILVALLPSAVFQFDKLVTGPIGLWVFGLLAFFWAIVVAAVGAANLEQDRPDGKLEIKPTSVPEWILFGVPILFALILIIIRITDYYI